MLLFKVRHSGGVSIFFREGGCSCASCGHLLVASRQARDSWLVLRAEAIELSAW
jgi:hypothetical protein